MARPRSAVYAGKGESWRPGIHPLEDGHNICTVQELLGHRGVSTP